MHYAMRSGHFNAVVFLYKHGAAGDLTHRAADGRVPLDHAKELGWVRLLRWSESLAFGEDWSPAAPGQVVTEAALCPAPRDETEGKETEEEAAERERYEAKKLAMEEAGLDSETFSGFV